MPPLTHDAFSDLLNGLTFDRLATALFFVVVTTIACLMPVQRVGIRHGDNNLQGFEVVKRCLHWLR